jgi:hypothetical protein
MAPSEIGLQGVDAMGPRSLRRRLPALALAGSLVLLPAAWALPVGSGPDGPATVREQAGGLLDWLGQAFLSLWAGDSGDNGMLIDPDGQATPGSNPSADGDNGMLIDPNG